jgi:hypothetical protein
MALTPEQTQLLQTYMMKNRNVPQAQPAPPVQLMPQSSGGSSGGLSNILSKVGSYFDTPNTPIQGPVRPGDAPLGTGTLPSQLTQFADRLDPMAAMQRKFLEQQQNAPKIDMQQVMKALAKAGIM